MVIIKKSSLKLSLEKVQNKECVIEVYGLGYVGFPLAIRLAMAGFQVIGIDSNIKKIKRLQSLKMSDFETTFRDEFLELNKARNLIFTNSSSKSEKTKLAIICVPTPIPSKSTPSDVFVINAVTEFLKNSKKGDVIILESSIEIGTTKKIQKLIDSFGLTVSQDFGLAFCPERIDPKNKDWNLKNIPRIIYCSDNFTYQICMEVYRHINNANLKRVKSAEIAEAVKSFENAFRLVNISLVNELAILCDKLGIGVKDVMDAAATKPFGFMPFYTSAGAGGHCIPKDPRFLLESAKKLGVQFKIIENALFINSFIPKYIVSSIEKIIEELKLQKFVLVCGLAYKPDIDDMRDSPGFKIIKELKEKKFKVFAYDPYYKKELKSKILEENYLEDLDVLDNLDDSNLQKFSCMCIVQHHTETKFRINEIYKNSTIPLIYDCQNELLTNKKSSTILKKLGG